MNIKLLTDAQLVNDTKFLITQEVKYLVAILEYLIEIESRKLFSEYKYSSMMDFVVHELGYSGGAASARLQSARLMKEIPEVALKLASREHSMCNLYKASIFFRREKITDVPTKVSILSKLEKKSALECEKILLELTPRPLPSESVRPVSKEHIQLKINVHESTHKKLDDVKCLLGFHLIDDEFFLLWPMKLKKIS